MTTLTPACSVGGIGIYAGARGTLEGRDLDSTGNRSALDLHLLP